MLAREYGVLPTEIMDMPESVFMENLAIYNIGQRYLNKQARRSSNEVEVRPGRL
jgi:hypothetical protein